MIDTAKTNDVLIEQLRASAAQPVTKAELTRQRVSFVYGNLPADSTITRAKVEERIKANEGV